MYTKIFLYSVIVIFCEKLRKLTVTPVTLDLKLRVKVRLPAGILFCPMLSSHFGSAARRPSPTPQGLLWYSIADRVCGSCGICVVVRLGKWNGNL